MELHVLKLAVVTMVYNESDFLPLWLRHYGRLAGIKNCFVVDHGSTDGSTNDVWGAGYVPLPRGQMDDRLRSNFISNFCNNLLRYFDWVIYVDVDELLVADPLYYRSIADLCEKTKYQTIRCIGLNVHEVQGDKALDVNKPVTLQRRHVRFGLSMCKPLLTRVPIQWTPGFHSADVNCDFDHLFLFHLAPCDYRINLRKLDRTRSMPWAPGTAGAHQRVTDQERTELLDRVGKMARLTGLTFDDTDNVLAERLKSIDGFVAEYPADRHAFYTKLHESSPQKELWEIPERFRGLV